MKLPARWRRYFPWRRRVRFAWLLTLVGGGIWLWINWQQFFLAHSQTVPKTGGIYTEASVGIQQNLNPLSPERSQFDQDINALIFSGLLRYDPSQQTFQSDLGRLEIIDNNSVYLVTLKPDLKFSDGSPLDIADVLFTYQTILQNPRFGNSALYQAWQYVEITTVDQQTISFRLPEGNTFFESLLTLPILPQKYFENVLIEEILDPDWFFNQRPIGTGPFRIKRRLTESKNLTRVFLEPNPHYHGAAPYFDQLVMYAYRSPEYLIAHHQDWASSFSYLPQSLISQLKNRLYDEYHTKKYQLPRMTGVFFNLDRPTVSHPSVRTAMAMTFDPSSVHEPGWQPLKNSFFHPDIQQYQPAQDEVAARILLRDNGFPYDRQREVRTRGRGGDPIRLTMITSTEPAVYSRFAQKLVNHWEKQLLIEIDLKVLHPEDFVKTISQRDYDLVLFGQNFTQNFDVLSIWHSSQSNKLNLSNLTREDIDFLIDEIRFTRSNQDYQALQDKLNDLHPALLIGTPDYLHLQHKNLLGTLENWQGLWNFSDRFTHVNNWHFYTKLDWDLPKNTWKIGAFFRWLWS